MFANQNPLLKVCGMRDAQNIKELIEIKPDYIGFIFYEKSTRFVGELFDENRLKIIPKTIKKTGVFVNASFEYIEKKTNRYQLDLLQLHGDETPELCNRLKSLNVEIIKVFSVGNKFDFSKVLPYGESVDFFLFDTKGKERGGNGVRFDWNILTAYQMDKPFFLSGGIGLSSIQKLKKFSHPKLKAFDINSAFEVQPGLKNIEAIRQFKMEIE